MTDPTPDRLAIHLSSDGTMADRLELAQYAEENGFDRVWRGETRLTQSAVVELTAYAAVTDEIELAAGVLPMWTRNVALMAQTWSTLYEFAGPRVGLGLGAWWEPLASKVGVDRRRPLRAMWEYSTVVRRLLDLENVTYDGDVVRVEDVELDLLHDDPEPRAVPLYVGATGPQMNEMAGELVGEGIVDGVFMNYMVPPEYTEWVVDRQRAGVEDSGGTIDEVDRPQLIGVSMADDRAVALDRARDLVTQYVAQQPHIREFSGIDGETADEIESIVGGWPASAADVERARHLVGDEVISDVLAVGTPDDVLEGVRKYCEAGCTEPALFTLEGTDPRDVMDLFADRWPP